MCMPSPCMVTIYIPCYCRVLHIWTITAYSLWEFALVGFHVILWSSSSRVCIQPVSECHPNAKRPRKRQHAISMMSSDCPVNGPGPSRRLFPRRGYLTFQRLPLDASRFRFLGSGGTASVHEGRHGVPSGSYLGVGIRPGGRTCDLCRCWVGHASCCRVSHTCGDWGCR